MLTDIIKNDIIVAALEDFNGTLIFISHDRYFINKFANKIIEFKDGKASTFIGNYDDYKECKNRVK